MRNDTYGEISSDELAAMRQQAATCTRCGMVANIDPVLHESRYGHAPVILDGPGSLIWSGDRMSWVAHTVKCQTCAAQIAASAILCGRCTDSARTVTLKSGHPDAYVPECGPQA